MSDPIRVVCAALVRADGRVLVNQRLPGTPQPGRWEFPGGKLDPGEAPAAGLARELDEELGIRPLDPRPLIRVRHDYPHRRVLLDCWRVERWDGEPGAREGHPLEWVRADELPSWDLLEADRPIVSALRLPSRHAVTADASAAALMAGITRLLDRGHTLIQLRAPSLPARAFRTVAADAGALCRARGATLLLNADPAVALELDADGIHLTAARLKALATRPLPADRWVGASCHDAAELAHARTIGCDFAVLGPVAPTTSHQGATPLGWARFGGLADRAGLPVYAIGGLGDGDLATAWAHHGQGVAAISAWWR